MEAYIIGLAVPLTLMCIAIIIYGIVLSIREIVAKAVKVEIQKMKPQADYKCGFIQKKEEK